MNAVIVEWQSLVPDELWHSVLSHLDVKTLIEKKRVSRSWRDTCTGAIDAKQTKAFSTKQELRQAVLTYCGYNEATQRYHQHCDPQDAEEFAQTYGYPINKWDVSCVQDLSKTFYHVCTFNEDISLWNVSNVTDMSWMFYYATAFNQDLSSWNVSNVMTMDRMFCHAKAFNQDLSSWNVSNVTVMSYMFLDARAFNQDLSSWNVSNVTFRSGMFRGAASFNLSKQPQDDKKQHLR
jgi:surface protein